MASKTIEVNASESRTGKRIMSIFGEASQSHLLGSKTMTQNKKTSGDGGPVGGRGRGDSVKKKINAKLNGKTMDSANSLVARARGRGSSLKNGRGGVGGNEPPPSPLKSDASLIVFEEIDILLDEDRGFLAAISDLISSTRRPIILLCNKVPPEARPYLTKSYVLDISRPSLSWLTLYFKLVLMCEGCLHIKTEIVERVVRRFECDIRRCFNELQLWLAASCSATARDNGYVFILFLRRHSLPCLSPHTFVISLCSSCCVVFCRSDDVIVMNKVSESSQRLLDGLYANVAGCAELHAQSFPLGLWHVLTSLRGIPSQSDTLLLSEQPNVGGAPDTPTLDECVSALEVCQEASGGANIIFLNHLTLFKEELFPFKQLTQKKVRNMQYTMFVVELVCFATVVSLPKWISHIKSARVFPLFGRVRRKRLVAMLVWSSWRSSLGPPT